MKIKFSLFQTGFSSLLGIFVALGLLAVALAFSLNVLFISHNQQLPQTPRQIELSSHQEFSSTRPTALLDNDTNNKVNETFTLDKTIWVLDSYRDQYRPQAVLEGTEISFEINYAEGTVSGYAGCNRYNGDIKISSDNLSINNVSATRMNCKYREGVMDQERFYLTALEASENYRIQGGKLRIFYSDNQVLTFSPKK